MSDEARDALERRRQQIIEESQARIAVIDQALAVLLANNKNDVRDEVSKRRRTSREGDTHAASVVDPGEFRLFDDIWPAIKIVLHRHKAYSSSTALDKDKLYEELKVGAAKLGTPERERRNALICIGQHGAHARYEKKTGKVWLKSNVEK